MNVPTVHHFKANTYPLGPGLRLLEASAGTGKTFALAHLVLRLITERQLKLRQLLVVTFTDVAAAELRDRIGKRLVDALAAFEAMDHMRTPKPPDSILAEWLESCGNNLERRRQWASYLLEAIEGLDHADITTIHGFCHRTLYRQALDSGVILKPTLEENSQERISQIVHDYWQQEVLQLPADDVEGLLDAKLNASSLIHMLHQLDQSTNLKLPETPGSISLEQALEPVFRLELRQRLRCFAELWRQSGRSLERQLRSQAAIWKERGAKNISPFYITQPRRDYCDEIDRWLVDESDPSYGSVRRLVTLGNLLHPGVFCRVACRCGETYPSFSLPATELQLAVASLWEGPAEITWHHALHHCQKRLQEGRGRDGVMTFTDLLLNLDRASKESTCLSTLRHRYRIALIDEFQDTDPIQWRVMRTIFAESPEHLLLIVGDPKQAIYGFRGGDLDTYLAARQQVQRRDVLVENFRTSAPLMKGLNTLMAPGMRRSHLDIPSIMPRGNVHPIQCPGESHPLELILLDTDDVEDGVPLPSSNSLSERIPALVATRAVKLLGDSRHLSPEDLCVLVSNHRQAEEIRKALVHVDLPSRLLSQGDILAGEAAAILQCFIDAIAQPNKSSHLRLLAISPLLGWTLAELKQADKNDRLDHLSEQMYSWSKLMPQLGLLGCLNGLLRGQAFARLSKQNHLFNDLQQCAQLVQQTMHEQGLTAASAAHWLRCQRQHPRDPVPDCRKQHSNVSEHAVTIITIHRSKGLEYPVVLCPYLWQVPPTDHGPVWRQNNIDGTGKHWTLALNSEWGKGRIAAADAVEQRCKESERLAYVALTRAKQMVILFWGRAINQRENPLANWLFDDTDHKLSIEEQNSVNLREGLERRGVPISLRKASALLPGARWRSPLPPDKLALGLIPRRPLDSCWGYSSYSAWASDNKQPDNGNTSLQVSKDNEWQQTTQLSQGSAYLSTNDAWDTQGPLATFPCGPSAGKCLHRILEQLPFKTSLEAPSSQDLICHELAKSGLKDDWLPAVQRGLDRALTTLLPLSTNEDKHSLADLPEGQFLRELNFDLPVAHKGSMLKAADVAACFRHEPDHRFAVKYADQVASLSFVSRGFLTGSIDLVICDAGESLNNRWWVLDWKSNWIGVRDSTGTALACGPHHYSKSAMEAQMLQHHYPLQAHLYLVVLHRYLSWRLTNYRPEQHLGGYIYAFLRGMPGKVSLCRKSAFVPGVIAEPAPLQRIFALDNLLREGGKA